MAAEPQACYPQFRAFKNTPFLPGDNQRTLADALIQECLLIPKLHSMLGDGSEALWATLE